MKTIEWVDERGYKRRSMLRDDDPDELAHMGIPLPGPPDLDQLDWGHLQRELHNALFNAGLFTWQDVQVAQTGVTSAILTGFKRPVVTLYRMEVNDD